MGKVTGFLEIDRQERRQVFVVDPQIQCLLIVRPRMMVVVCLYDRVPAVLLPCGDVPNLLEGSSNQAYHPLQPLTCLHQTHQMQNQ